MYIHSHKPVKLTQPATNGHKAQDIHLISLQPGESKCRLTNLMGAVDVQEEKRKWERGEEDGQQRRAQSQTMTGHSEGGGKEGGVWCSAMVEGRALAACQQQGQGEGGSNPVLPAANHMACCYYKHSCTNTCILHQYNINTHVLIGLYILTYQ